MPRIDLGHQCAIIYFKSRFVGVVWEHTRQGSRQEPPNAFVKKGARKLFSTVFPEIQRREEKLQKR